MCWPLHGLLSHDAAMCLMDWRRAAGTARSCEFGVQLSNEWQHVAGLNADEPFSAKPMRIVQCGARVDARYTDGRGQRD